MDNAWANLKSSTESTYGNMSNEHIPYPTMDKYITKPEERPELPAYNPWNMMAPAQE